MSDERKRSGSSRKGLSDEAQLKHLADFLENLSWLLQSNNKKMDFRGAANLVRKVNSARIETLSLFQSDEDNVQYLVGVLPRLFIDAELFPKNEDISDFASDLLGINISRVGKRSRYELIGLVVCAACELDNQELGFLVEKLKSVRNDSEALKRAAQQRSATGFSWNHAIRTLDVK